MVEMRPIDYPRGKVVEVCHLCEREAKDTDEETLMEELWKRLQKARNPEDA
jgi:hypothetical protein